MKHMDQNLQQNILIYQIPKISNNFQTLDINIYLHPNHNNLRIHN